MNKEEAAQFSRAVNLAQTGNKAAAHNTFSTLSTKHPDNILALLWFAYTSPSIGQAQGAISRATQLEPNNPNVLQAQSWFQSEMAKSKSVITPLTHAIKVTSTSLNEQPQTFTYSQKVPQPAYSQYESTLEASQPNGNGDFNTRFNQGVLQTQAGNKTQAYQELKAFARETSTKDANLLLWIAFTSPDLEEADISINMAEIQSPGNTNMSGAKSWLRMERLKATNNCALLGLRHSY